MACEEYTTSTCGRTSCFCTALFGIVAGGLLLVGVVMKKSQEPELNIPVKYYEHPGVIPYPFGTTRRETPLTRLLMGVTPTTYTPMELGPTTYSSTDLTPITYTPFGKMPTRYMSTGVTGEKPTTYTTIITYRPYVEMPTKYARNEMIPVSYKLTGEPPFTYTTPFGEMPLARYTPSGPMPKRYAFSRSSGEKPVAHIFVGETPVTYPPTGWAPIMYTPAEEMALAYAATRKPQVVYKHKRALPTSFTPSPDISEYDYGTPTYTESPGAYTQNRHSFYGKGRPFEAPEQLKGSVIVEAPPVDDFASGSSGTNESYQSSSSSLSLARPMKRGKDHRKRLNRGKQAVANTVDTVTGAVGAGVGYVVNLLRRIR